MARKTYHIDTDFEGERLVDNVTILEKPKKHAKKVFVYSPHLRANIYVRIADLSHKYKAERIKK